MSYDNDTLRDCHDCGVKPGEFHLQGCDTEYCALCGTQCISCQCVYRVSGIDTDTLEEKHPDLYNMGPGEDLYEAYDMAVESVGGPLPWTGKWQGVNECVEYGLYSRWVSRKTGKPVGYVLDDPGTWQKCKAEDEGAGPDLNELHNVCSWDVKLRRYVLHEHKKRS